MFLVFVLCLSIAASQRLPPCGVVCKSEARKGDGRFESCLQNCRFGTAAARTDFVEYIPGSPSSKLILTTPHGGVMQPDFVNPRVVSSQVLIFWFGFCVVCSFGVCWTRKSVR